MGCPGGKHHHPGMPVCRAGTGFLPRSPPPATFPPMTTATWITMAAILFFVWGGFVTALVVAVRKEGEKLRRE